MARNPGRKSKAAEVEEEVEDQEEDQEEEGEEYEIEDVVEYKSSAFKSPPGPGYKVKWKGYGEEENSWVRPTDALGAWELIEQYWAKRGKVNPHAHLKPKDDEENEDEDEEMPDVEPTPEPEPAPKKRGRPSAAARSPERTSSRKSEPKEELDTKKRGRKSNGTTSVVAPAAKKARRTSSPVPKAEVEETVVHPSRIAAWKERKDWNSYVTEITTIEHDKKKLFVYFKLKGLKDPCSESLDLCRERFPGKLLDFYEKNLRWRSVEGSDDEGK